MTPLRAALLPMSAGAVVLASAMTPNLAPGPAPAEPVPLAAGSAVSRAMATEQTHRYVIALRAGEYLQVHVEQHGVDVTQTLSAPDGAVGVETDSPSGFLGPDPLAVIATATGPHELRLTAGYAQSGARYELRVEQVRAPSAEDRLRAQAVRDTADGFRLVGQDQQKRLQAFKDAAAAWNAAGDARMRMWSELMTRFYRGLVQERRPPAEALRLAQQEMSVTRRWSSPFHWAGFVLQGDGR